MSDLIETLATELQRPRELSARVISYISGNYGIDGDAIGVFLLEKLAQLEEYEVDLILSPVFTPKLADQAVFAELLGAESIPREKWQELVQQLAARPTRAQLIVPDGRSYSVALREVALERYIHRLRLEGSISRSDLELLDRVPSADGPMVKAVARRAVWANESVRGILVAYLTRAHAQGSYSLADTIELLNLVEGRKPASLEDLLARIPGWQKALREQVDGAGPKQFFNEDVRMMHGGDRDQRQQGDSRMSAKERELDFLARLQLILAG